MWYASADPKFSRQKAIVGTSYLDEVIIGPAKDLFNKHKKYGIYEWDTHIKPMARGDEKKCIKILKFSNSESFQHIIPYHKLITLLKVKNQKHNNFTSPVKIKSDIFADIYKQAKGI